MKIITIKNQKQFNKLPRNFESYTRIVIEDAKIDTINFNPVNSFYVIRGKSIINNVFNCIIDDVYGHCVIKDAFGSCIIKDAYENCVIEEAHGNCIIERAHENCVIKYAYEDCVVQRIYGNCVIKYAYENCIIKDAYGNCIIDALGYVSILSVSGYATVNTYGYNVVRYCQDEKDIELNLSPETKRIVLKKRKITLEEYKKLFPVDREGKKYIFYKVVRKKRGKYFSDWDKKFKYEIGKTYEQNIDENKRKNCSFGLHVAHKCWAKEYGKDWKNLAILECSVDEKDILVPYGTDGKIRCSKLKVLREIE